MLHTPKFHGRCAGEVHRTDPLSNPLYKAKTIDDLPETVRQKELVSPIHAQAECEIPSTSRKQRWMGKATTARGVKDGINYNPFESKHIPNHFFKLWCKFYKLKTFTALNRGQTKCQWGRYTNILDPHGDHALSCKHKCRVFGNTWTDRHDKITRRIARKLAQAAGAPTVESSELFGSGPDIKTTEEERGIELLCEKAKIVAYHPLQ